MKNIAILTGGDSEERVISLKSGRVVADHLPADRYRTFLIDVQKADWHDLDSGIQVDKNDFTLTLDDEKIRFDCAFAALHGSPLEDGKMQGYLEMLGIPYTCCDGYVSALTMNKHNTKTQLAPYGVPLAKSLLLHRGEPVPTDRLLALGLPLFVKPNTHGSSFGVSKVKTVSELQPALDEAWRFGDEVVVESFMPGREFANGAFRHKGKIEVLPVTEIIPETEFFDFAAKYEVNRRRSLPPTSVPTSPASARSVPARCIRPSDAAEWCASTISSSVTLFTCWRPTPSPGFHRPALCPSRPGRRAGTSASFSPH